MTRADVHLHVREEAPQDGSPEVGAAAVIRAAKGLPAPSADRCRHPECKSISRRSRGEGAAGLFCQKVSKGLRDGKEKALGSLQCLQGGDMVYLYYVHYLQFSRLAALQSSLNKACQCPLLRRAQKSGEKCCSTIAGPLQA